MTVLCASFSLARGTAIAPIAIARASVIAFIRAIIAVDIVIIEVVIIDVDIGVVVDAATTPIGIPGTADSCTKNQTSSKSGARCIRIVIRWIRRRVVTVIIRRG